MRMPSWKRANVTPIPILKPQSLATSGTFEGDDGRWSTFLINIAGDGDGQGQNFKVLISTSSPITLVPGQSGWCDTDDCAKSRGVMSIINGQQALGLNIDGQQKFWRTSGLYSLPFNTTYWWSPELLTVNRNDSLNGEWGITTVGLGLASKQSLTIPNQYVATSIFEDLFLGSLGMSVGTIGPDGVQQPTFFSGLASHPELIPSHSYGYTAGAAYRNDGRGVRGSMVFGGYDKARLITQQNTTINMPNQQNNTLVVGIQSIIYKPNQNVQQGASSITKTINGGFYAIIDSTFPYLVLPDDICEQFVQKFNLGFDNTTRLYTINSTAHERNLQQNASVSFKIGKGSQDSASSTTIVLPYLAFYLQARSPISTNVTDYFPIRRSGNGFYILGRTFLQEAYLVVDYERATFTVAPAYFSDPMPPNEDLITIFNTTYVPLSGPRGSGGNKLSAGAIAGIVIGIVAVFLFFGGGAFLYYKKRRAAKAKALETEEKPGEIDTTVAGDELHRRRVSELTGSEPPYSPQAKPVGYYGGDHKSIPELSPDSTPAELWSPPADSTEGVDYFSTAPKPRRRGATRSSTGNNTPGTPVAELPGDDGKYQVAGQHFEAAVPLQRPKPHSRGPSDTSLSTNIAEVLAGPDKDTTQVEKKHSSRFLEHTSDDVGPSRAEMVVSPLENTRADERDPSMNPAQERRPSHVRGPSDTTINSESTAVSQLTPEELGRWGRAADDGGPNRPESPQETK